MIQQVVVTNQLTKYHCHWRHFNGHSTFQSPRDEKHFFLLLCIFLLFLFSLSLLPSQLFLIFLLESAVHVYPVLASGWVTSCEQETIGDCNCLQSLRVYTDSEKNSSDHSHWSRTLLVMSLSLASSSSSSSSFFSPLALVTFTLSLGPCDCLLVPLSLVASTFTSLRGDRQSTWCDHETRKRRRRRRSDFTRSK